MEFKIQKQKINYEFLEFDSRLLGIQVVKVKEIYSEGKLLSKLLGSFEANLKQKPVLLVFRVDSLEIDLIEELQNNGFKTVENLITFQRDIKENINNNLKLNKLVIRQFKQNDISDLVKFGSKEFSLSHYYRNKSIPTDKINNLKSEWIKNNCTGRADFVFVAEYENKIAGFCSLIVKDKLVIIDLISVFSNFKKLNIASIMLNKIIIFLNQKNYSKLNAGTQSHNIPSMRFYIKNKFNVIKSEYTLHKLIK